jgi:hypothetical protein
MRATVHRTAKAEIPLMARHARRRLEAAQAQWPEAPDMFSDRHDDAAEYASLMRDFECVRDEALGSGRYS